MLRRQPRRIRLANCLGGLLPVVIPVVTFFFPLSGWYGFPAGVSTLYWSGTPPTEGASFRLTLSPAECSAMTPIATTSALCVRCVRAREGQAVPCFFPLSGSANTPEIVEVYVWSSTKTGGVTPYWRLRIGVSEASGGFIREAGSQLSIRCVRAREEQAVPLFWIKEFFVL